jgi:mono/diheme cytochrome c family protein
MHRAVALIWLATVLSCAAADVQRGRALHDSTCTVCHDTSMYRPDPFLSKNYVDVRRAVERWQQVIGIGWTATEIDDVAAYLNRQYFGYACTGAAC